MTYVQTGERHKDSKRSLKESDHLPPQDTITEGAGQRHGPWLSFGYFGDFEICGIRCGWCGRLHVALGVKGAATDAEKNVHRGTRRSPPCRLCHGNQANNAEWRECHGGRCSSAPEGREGEESWIHASPPSSTRHEPNLIENEKKPDCLEHFF